MAINIKEKIKDFPQSPGVYIMRSAKRETLYVGKAFSLRRRVRGYFRRAAPSQKIASWIEKVQDIEFIACDTEAQALILEAALIKEKKPKYNIALRDDKSYPYIEVTEEDFPRLSTSRPKTRRESSFFGPYPNVKLVKQALKLIRKIFPYRSCRKLPKKACLFYHLNLCPAPCVGKISSGKYKEMVENICKILSGDKKSLIDSLEKKMEKHARGKKFEQAALFRDKLVAICNLYSGKAQLHQIIFLKELLRLPKLPLLIEAIDVSNLSGKEAAGSAVVFRDGIASQGEYRRYKIKRVNYPNDYQMIAEVVKRRYSRLKNEQRPFPQLIIVDGGGAHVNKAEEILRELKLNIPVIGIAKRNEELWLPKITKPVVIPRNNPSLHLIQRIRDEAHRFAHNYHTLLRKKKMLVKKPNTRNQNV